MKNAPSHTLIADKGKPDRHDSPLVTSRKPVMNADEYTLLPQKSSISLTEPFITEKKHTNAQIFSVGITEFDIALGTHKSGDWYCIVFILFFASAIGKRLPFRSDSPIIIADKSCEIYITMEPCMMCCGAIQHSRIKKIVYGVKNENYGYIHNLKNIKIISKICEKECRELVQSFFKKRR